jgi:hypothetical protein
MPRLYRAMYAEGNKPKVGAAATALGVRVPPDKHADLPAGNDGMVEPGTGGMSVSPAWRLLPVHRILRRLRTKFPRAAGSNQLFCWRFGESGFAAALISDQLMFRPDPEKPDRHGLVEPAQQMKVEEYQAALAATRDQWVIDEE